MCPTWGRQDPGWPHVGAMILAIWDAGRVAKRNGRCKRYFQMNFHEKKNHLDSRIKMHWNAGYLFEVSFLALRLSRTHWHMYVSEKFYQISIFLAFKVFIYRVTNILIQWVTYCIKLHTVNWRKKCLLALYINKSSSTFKIYLCNAVALRIFAVPWCQHNEIPHGLLKWSDHLSKPWGLFTFLHSFCVHRLHIFVDSSRISN